MLVVSIFNRVVNRKSTAASIRIRLSYRNELSRYGPVLAGRMQIF